MGFINQPAHIPDPFQLPYLHPELILKGAQRRLGVVGPVTPGASGKAVLAESGSIDIPCMTGILPSVLDMPCKILRQILAFNVL